MAKPLIYVRNDPREIEDKVMNSRAIKGLIVLALIAAGYAWAILQELP